MVLAVLRMRHPAVVAVDLAGVDVVALDPVPGDVGPGPRGALARDGRAGDVAIGLVGLSPGVGVAVVAWLLVAGAGVLALQSPGSEKRTLSRPGSVLKVRLQQKPI